MGLITGGLRAAQEGGVQKTNDVCVRGQFWAMPKTEVESVSKSKAYFETLSYKPACKRQSLAIFFILVYNHNMSELITPRVLKGFRDYTPKLEIRRQLLSETLRTVFRRFGFIPIDTPALEFSEVLLRKSNGETEKQVFRFTDNGGRDVALRFDLTVPLAMAQMLTKLKKHLMLISR